MNYKSKIEKLEPLEKFKSKTNNVFLYDLDSKKVVYLERKDKSLEKQHPFEKISVPKIVGLKKEEIKWMSYEDQFKHSKDLQEAGINVVEFLEIGKDYAIREFMDLETLRKKLSEDDYSSLDSWFTSIFNARRKNISLTDRITRNTFIDKNNNPLFFDFDLSCSNNEYSLAQAIFYSSKLSLNPEKSFEIIKKVLEKEKNGFDYDKIKFFCNNYVDKVINPNSIENILHRIEFPEMIKTKKDKLEHSKRLTKLFKNYFK